MLTWSSALASGALLWLSRSWLLIDSATPGRPGIRRGFRSSTSVILPSRMKTLRKSSSSRQPWWIRPVVVMAGSSRVMGPSAMA